MLITCPKCQRGTLEVSRTPGIPPPLDLVASHPCGAVYYGRTVEALALSLPIPPPPPPEPRKHRRASRAQFRSEPSGDGICISETCEQPIPPGRRSACSRRCVIRMANVRYRARLRAAK